MLNKFFKKYINYKIIIYRKGNKFYKIIIPDYKIIDYDKNLFGFLHFLFNFEEKNEKNQNMKKKKYYEKIYTAAISIVSEYHSRENEICIPKKLVDLTN